LDTNIILLIGSKSKYTQGTGKNENSFGGGGGGVGKNENLLAEKRVKKNQQVRGELAGSLWGKF
jgi:hypothetical protein